MTTDQEARSAGSTSGHWMLAVAAAVTLASAVWHLVMGEGEPGVRFVLLTVLLFAIRRAEVPPTFTAAFVLLMLLATWASVHHWYRDIAWADEVVHVLTPGSLAATAYFVLVHFDLMPGWGTGTRRLRSWSPVLWVAVVGVTAAVLWEFYEWVVEQISPRGMIVGYTDTVLDLAAGTVGSVVAGVLVLAWSRSDQAGVTSSGDASSRGSVSGSSR
ncbi:hypothetical protein [Nocardioides sp. SYSU DS0651]|uniref:hypothetical protein n=1 Tax=Nocardioides sp. SYSU DS0651 TaxID=3415955 RepID=UPI003F4CA165